MDALASEIVKHSYLQSSDLLMLLPSFITLSDYPASKYLHTEQLGEDINLGRIDQKKPS